MLDHVYNSQKTFKPMPIRRKSQGDYIVFDGNSLFLHFVDVKRNCHVKIAFCFRRTSRISNRMQQKTKIK